MQRTLLLYILTGVMLAGCRTVVPATTQTPSEATPAASSLPAATIRTTPSVPATATSILPAASGAPTAVPPVETIPEPTANTGLSGSFPFIRPILPPGRDEVDPSYRFGTTQDGVREPHHGVEFLNSFGTPVTAAADGKVLFAGDDFNGSPFSPEGWYAFYGLFVVLEHQILAYEQPVYTLYAHLSEVNVQTGDSVRRGETVGLVGFSGAAIGSHLHFEVRYGGTAYGDVRNPELWLLPKPGRGALAGRIVDPAGLPLPILPLQLTSLEDGYTQFFSTYEEDALREQAPFFESFALTDIPSGTYELSFIGYALERHTLTIRAGELTFLDITLSPGE